MALFDYLRCKHCDLKMLYDGDWKIRKRIANQLNTPEEHAGKIFICTQCLETKYKIIDGE